MTNLRNLPKTIACLSAAAVLAGCGGVAEEVADVEIAPAAKPELSLVELESDGSSASPMAIGYAFDSEPTVGQPLVISVSVSGEQASELLLQTSTRGGVSLSDNSPASIALKPNPTVAEPATAQLVVTPEEPGRSYVNLQIGGLFEGRTFTTAKTIPIQAVSAEPNLDTNGNVIDTGVEVLSSLPAQEDMTAP
ncbi:MAG: hypothetical protein AAFN07_11580 [Pseudomonadota bacterium]